MRTRNWSVAAIATPLASPAPALAQGEVGGAALFDVNFGLTIWTVVVFGLLVFVLGKFAWGPILASARSREERIQDALDEADRRRSEAAEVLERHRTQLAAARRQAQELVNEGKAAGERVRRDIEANARAEGQALLERARGEIEREKDAALDEIRKESVALTLAAAARLMNEKLDADKDRRLVLGYLDQLGRRPGAGSQPT